MEIIGLIMLTNYHNFFIIFSIIICSLSNCSIITSKDSHNELSSKNISKEKYIAYWADYDLRNQDWYIRSSFNERFLPISQPLKFYYHYYGHFPSSFSELEVLGLTPIYAIDPVSLDVYEYNACNGVPVDYLDTLICADKKEWRIKYLHQKDNGSFKISELSTDNDAWILDIVYFPTKEKYPSLEALRGYNLSFLLHQVLVNYCVRRNKMPTNSSELMDNLFVVTQEWAKSNDQLDTSKECVFLFGFDFIDKKLISIWGDRLNNYYYINWFFRDLPTEGWIDKPSPEEITKLYNICSGYDIIERGQIDKTEFETITEEIDLILWNCNLQINKTNDAAEK